jgi:hypothetical protein
MEGAIGIELGILGHQVTALLSLDLLNLVIVINVHETSRACCYVFKGLGSCPKRWRCILADADELERKMNEAPDPTSEVKINGDVATVTGRLKIETREHGLRPVAIECRAKSGAVIHSWLSIL